MDCILIVPFYYPHTIKELSDDIATEDIPFLST